MSPEFSPAGSTSNVETRDVLHWTQLPPTVLIDGAELVFPEYWDAYSQCLIISISGLEVV